jgi:hypothetical protein
MRYTNYIVTMYVGEYLTRCTLVHGGIRFSVPELLSIKTYQLNRPHPLLYKYLQTCQRTPDYMFVDILRIEFVTSVTISNTKYPEEMSNSSYTYITYIHTYIRICCTKLCDCDYLPHFTDRKISELPGLSTRIHIFIHLYIYINIKYVCIVI